MTEKTLNKKKINQPKTTFLSLNISFYVSKFVIYFIFYGGWHTSASITLRAHQLKVNVAIFLFVHSYFHYCQASSCGVYSGIYFHTQNILIVNTRKKRRNSQKY